MGVFDSEIPLSLDRAAHAGKAEDTNDAVCRHKHDDPVSDLSEPGFGAEAEVEDENRGLHEPGAHGVDVGFCKIILEHWIARLEGCCAVSFFQETHLLEGDEFPKRQVPDVHTKPVLSV